MSPLPPVVATKPLGLSEQLAALVLQVQRQKGYGLRRAKRYVGRRANPFTLTVWRKTGKFPIGFRRGSKA